MYEAESAARLNAPADGEAARGGRGAPRKIGAPCPGTKKAAEASAAKEPRKKAAQTAPAETAEEEKTE